MKNMYYSYILFSKTKNKYYIGYTEDLRRRFNEHKTHQVTTTKDYAELELVWYAAFKSKDSALSFEKYLKSSSGFSFRNKRLV